MRTQPARRTTPLADLAGPADRGAIGWPVLAGLALLVGVLLRFVATSPLWLDEAQSVAIARLPLPRLLEALRADGSPPLYYLLLHAWMSLFGATDTAVRAFSGCCAVTALPLLYRIPAGPAAKVTLALAAVNPWLLRYATEARMYALEVLLVLIGVVALRGVWRRPGLVRAAGLATVTGLLLLTHYWALFLASVVALAVLVEWVRRGSAAAGWALLGLAAGAVPFGWWVPSFTYQLRHTGTPWGSEATLAALPGLVADWSGASAGAAELSLVVWPLVVAGAVYGGRPAQLLAATGAATLVLSVGVSQLSGAAVMGRYTAVVVPLVLLVLGYGVASLPGRWRPALAVLLVLAWGATSFTQVNAQRTQAGAVAAALNRYAADRDTVLFCPDQLGPAVVRRLAVRPALHSLPAQPWPGRLDWTDYRERVRRADPAALARLAAAGRTPVWLVTAPGYRPFGDRCERLRDSLTTVLGPGRRLVTAAGAGERASLWRWPAH